MRIPYQLTLLLVFVIPCQIDFFYLNHKSSTNALGKKNEGTKEMKVLLKKSLSNDPLSVWLVKDRFPTMRHLHVNVNDLNSCIKNEINNELDNVLDKVFGGKDIHMVVFGGSNTAGGGLQEEENSLKGTFFNILHHWWKKVVTPITGSRLKMKVIGIGGTSSSFFQFCHEVYLTHEYSDLVLLELSVNDAKASGLKNINKSLPLEQFIRQLISRHNHPALFFVNTFSTITKRLGCLNLMDYGQGLLCDHYNITTFNLRDLVCDRKGGKFIVSSKTYTLQANDRVHVNFLAHARIALMIITVISKSLMKLMSRGYKYNNTSHLPYPVYIKAQNNMIEHPLCWTTLTPNYKTQEIYNTLDASVIKQKGFAYVKDVLIGGLNYTGIVYRTDAYSGWVGEKYDSHIAIAFTVVLKETLMLSRSVGLVSRMSYDGGITEVWLNDDYKDRVIVHHRHKYRQTLVRMIAAQVPPGEHTLNVRIIKDGTVSIIGIVIGPPDGPY